MPSEPRRPAVGPKGKIVGAILLAIAVTLGLEGGYVNDPVDPGGETNHGVTINVARDHGYTGPMRQLKKRCDFPIEVPATVAATLTKLEREDLQNDDDGDEVCAAQIYFDGYIDKPGYVPLFAIDSWVAQEVFDTAINMGPSRPSRFFQRAVNRQCQTTLEVDGKIGPATVNAWQDCRANLGPAVCVAMIRDLDAQQADEYRRLIRRNPSLRRFERGWMSHRIGNVDPRSCFRSL